MPFNVESLLSSNTISILGQATNTLNTVLSFQAADRAAAQQAEGLRSAGNATVAAANFNNKIDRINTLRRVEAETRQTDRLLSAQRAAAAGSGFSGASQSFLTIANNTLTQLERTVLHERASFSHRETANLFEARSRQHALEVQAASAEITRGMTRGKQMSGVIGSIGSLLGSFGGTS